MSSQAFQTARQSIIPLTIEELEDLQKLIKDDIINKKNKELSDKLVKKFEIIDDCIGCGVSYEYVDSVLDMVESVLVVIKLKQGNHKVNIKVNRVRTVEIDTTFGKLLSKDDTNTLTALPYDGWIIGDSYHLLQTINEVCMEKYRKAVERVIYDSKPDEEYEPSQAITQFNILSNISHILTDYGFNDTSVHYTHTKSEEECILTVYKDEKEIGFINILWHKWYNMFPLVEIFRQDGLTKELIYKLVEKALPVYGTRAAKVLRIQDE